MRALRRRYGRAAVESPGAQMQWHRKPNTGLCDICGVGPKLRKGVEHRAYTAEEAWKYGAPYVKRVTVGFGGDWDERTIDASGARVHSGR